MGFFKSFFNFGSQRDDQLVGTDRFDLMFGRGGNDTFFGKGGNDWIFGGRGTDTAIYAGVVSDYDIWNPTGRGIISTVRAKDGAPETGTDRLTQVEALYFQADDYTYYLDGTNNAALARDDSFGTDENSPLAITVASLLANDSEYDGDTLTVTGVDAVSSMGIAISFVDGVISYDPGSAFDSLSLGETATDTFSYTVDDGKGGSDTATVTLTITGQNDAPVLTIASDITVEENSLDLATAAATDADGDAITFSLSGVDAARFAIDPASGALAFVEAPDFETPGDADEMNDYQITVTATDANGASDSADVTVTVSDVVEIAPRINEIHYDNGGSDVGEFVEIRLAAGADPTALSLVLYNGNGGRAYETFQLPAAPVNGDETYAYYVIETPGLQNGSPDGLALIDATRVVEFLSYEGSLTADDGPAEGLTSTDIGVAENGGTLAGESLQRNADGTWREAAAETRGAENTFVSSARINEIHYDNAGSDQGEFVEIRVAAGEDTTGLALTLYNGSNGTAYGEVAVVSDLAKSSDDSFDYYLLSLPSNGLQNGGPDGLALTRDQEVLEFLSYEGAFDAVDGAAAGATSTDIGVAESSATEVGESLQRNADGSWRDAAAETPGAANTPIVVAPVTARINEFHYDNAGSDIGEFVEIRTEAGEDVTGLTLTLYNGSNGGAYGTVASVGALTKSTDGSFDYYLLELPANGLQNGGPDGLALANDAGLIEFLSYEGSFTATDGAASGETSTDIGVSESSATAIGESLQRNADGTWRAAEVETRGASNDGVAASSARINEFHYDNDGGDVGEFIEVRVNRDEDVSGLTLTLYNGSGGAVYGDVAAVADLTKMSDDSFDYYVLELPANGLQNGNDGIALADGSSLIEFLSYEGGFTAVGGAADGVEATNLDVAESSSTPVGSSLQRNEDGTWRGPEAATSGASNDTIVVEPALPARIWEVQGSGSASPLEGVVVTVDAIVSYVLDGRGFFLLEETADADGDATTSDGIFVFTGATDLPNLGDRLSVTGTVAEFFDETQINAIQDITLISTDNALADIPEIALAPDTVQDFEAIEGMRFSLVSGVAETNITVIENFNLDRFGEISVSAGNQWQPTQLFDAQTQATEVAALATANQNNRLAIDDGQTGQNPDAFEFIPVDDGPGGNGYLDKDDTFSADGPTFRLGAEVDGATEGVMTYSFDEYKMLVDGTLNLIGETNEGARDDAPDPVGGDIQVAAINVLNYFTTLSGQGTSGPNGLNPRGANSPEDLVRQTDKIVQMMLGTEAEVFALQEIENGGFGPDSAIATLVNALNTAVGGETYAFVDPTTNGTGFIGTDAITTGIIYDQTKLVTTHAEVLVFEEASAATTFALAETLNPFASSDDQVGDFQRNRPAVAATFVALEAPGTPSEVAEPFTVVSNHFKSKGDSNLEDLFFDAQNALNNGAEGLTQADIDALRADGNYDAGDGQGFWNAARADAAAEVLEWVTTTYNGAGTDNFLILGDLNAYAQDDPTQVLRDADGTVDLIDTYIGQEDAYSFVFDGQRGTLDQAFASDSMAAQVTGVSEWHINADEPDLLGYNSQFNDAGFYDPSLFGASDHDPVIIGLNTLGLIDVA